MASSRTTLLLVALVLSMTPQLLQGAGSERVLTLVARDQSGAVVADLRAEELQILDNGTAQTVGGFKTPEKLNEGPGLVTLVFGGLSNQGRQYARRAANELLGQLEGGAPVSVLVVDRRLYALSSFTTSEKDLKEAVEVATSGTFERYRKRSEEIEKELTKSGRSQSDRVVSQVLDRSGRMQREEWTYAALDSLNVLVDELAGVPGRKTVVFLSEGLVIRDVMFQRFNLLISSAAAARTVIHTVDARGLLTSGLADGSRSMLEGARDASANQEGALSSWNVTALEAAGQSVRMNAQDTIATLADLTGGTLLANTNDSLSGMQRIANELGRYYEVTYSPDSKADGALRQVTVSVSRPGVQLFFPKAYIDLPDVGGARIESFELPLLEALNDQPLASDFPLMSRVLHFGAGAEGLQHTLALEVPMKSFLFAEDRDAKRYSTYFSLLALIRNASGRVVQKISQDYPIEGPLDKMDSLKAGNVLLLRNFYLQPGSYTVETVARDNYMEKASAVKQPLEVPALPDGPALSSVMVIDRVDPISDPAKEADNPLRYKEMKIAPKLGAPVVKDPSVQIGFYCVLYPAKSSPQEPVMSMLFFKDGQPLFQGKPPLPAPDDQGRLQVVLNLPLASFQPGNYEVVAVVEQGEKVAEERAQFRVVE